MEYKPKVRSIYNGLVNEYIKKVVEEENKEYASSAKCVVGNVRGCNVRIINPNNIIASRRNRNYNNSLLVQYQEIKK